MQTLAGNISQERHIMRVLTYYDTGNPSFVSRDRNSTVMAAFFGNYDNITRNEVAEKIQKNMKARRRSCSVPRRSSPTP